MMADFMDTEDTMEEEEMETKPPVDENMQSEDTEEVEGMDTEEMEDDNG